MPKRRERREGREKEERKKRKRATWSKAPKQDRTNRTSFSSGTKIPEAGKRAACAHAAAPYESCAGVRNGGALRQAVCLRSRFIFPRHRSLLTVETGAAAPSCSMPRPRPGSLRAAAVPCLGRVIEFSSAREGVRQSETGYAFAVVGRQGLSGGWW